MVEENPPLIKAGDAALVKMVPMKPLVVGEMDKFPMLGRFVVRDNKATIAVGVVKKVFTKE